MNMSDEEGDQSFDEVCVGVCVCVCVCVCMCMYVYVCVCMYVLFSYMPMMSIGNYECVFKCFYKKDEYENFAVEEL